MGAEQLIKDIKKARNNWDERSQFVLAGVDNLSVADLDVLELYAEYSLKYGSFAGLMEPLGSISKVLDAYRVLNAYRFSNTYRI